MSAPAMSDGPANLREPSRGFRMVTSDLSEAIAAVSRLYCPHDVTVRGREVPVSSRLEVLRGGPQPIVELRYSAPVRIDAGRFENLLLVTAGTTLGMMLANVPAVYLGEAATRVVPLKVVRIVAGVIFALIGLWVLASAFLPLGFRV